MTQKAYICYLWSKNNPPSDINQRHNRFTLKRIYPLSTLVFYTLFFLSHNSPNSQLAEKNINKFSLYGYVILEKSSKFMWTWNFIFKIWEMWEKIKTNVDSLPLVLTIKKNFRYILLKLNFFSILKPKLVYTEKNSLIKFMELFKSWEYRHLPHRVLENLQNFLK